MLIVKHKTKSLQTWQPFSKDSWMEAFYGGRKTIEEQK